MHAPKQKDNVKAQFAYSGRYIRRPAIAVGRVDEYDGKYVAFRYTDKTDGQEKTETVTAKEFIARLIDIPQMNILKRFIILVYMPVE